ncbi:glycosyltransferase [Halothiobacillus sp.]|jgi:GT2 family glycosyltransferase|uniref:glycosyltransferase family 2 protein n=1 Tax=Halothiobacillus sp. TaxID=1891311 RepID=UPI0026055146|nr:glycosyltransferase [Halothiobacillus sp.]MDD3575813.1 glycosyltransferase [Halothiobacillus sp.]MDD4967266.1 glycosyltransferase [Halothiobacillus sp.]
MSQPTISICIANYNGEAVLVDCIDSVLAQQGQIELEILVHDDASTDNSINLLRERYPQERFPYLHIIESSENVGFCISNNRMAAQAKGEYLLLLNNDAALAPDALQTLLEAARAQTPQGILTLPQHDWQSGELVDRGDLLDPFYNPIPNLDPARRDVAMVIGACLWIPRTLWKNLGGFPEWFESIAEDMQLCCHARLSGYPVQVTEASFYRHRQGASFGGNRVNANRLTTTYRRRRLSERNKTYVMILCSPPLQLWITLPIHLALLAFEGITLALIKGDKRLWKDIYANVFTSLFRNAGRLRKERQKIQQMRKLSTADYTKGFSWVPRKLQMLLRHGLPKVS